ncbi:hypothetical protein ACFL2E_00510 [Thermodesulfobacteriota bacterium]
MADLFYIEPAFIAVNLLETCHPVTHLAKGNFGILVLLVLQRLPIGIYGNPV